ncbi:MAG: FAD-dependent oxidoreductase [Bacillota bacterium]|nr:FAD-dependent oxidoreductase [Bacillota bacterium]
MIPCQNLDRLFDVIVIGAGPAGLAAALAAWEEGARDVLICERATEPGGILDQCIHNGFGLEIFREELTGPEYAGRYLDLLAGTGVELLTDTMVIGIDGHETTEPGAGTMSAAPDVHLVRITGARSGCRDLRARAVVLAMGCRERSRGGIALPGSRPSGILTAGAAQRYVNIEGWSVGRRVVILGSGDIGLIMARRLTLEGARVLACVELLPWSGGLIRNIVQCLNDFDIPLLLGHTVIAVHGRRRLEGVTVAAVDPDSRRPIPGTEQHFDCDTLLLSVGLIPENELTRAAGIPLDSRTRGAVVDENMETGTPGIFACGNVLHVHDLVDYVSAESARAGRAAARYALSREARPDSLAVLPAGELSYVVPQRLTRSGLGRSQTLYGRVRRPLPQAQLLLESDGVVLARWKRERLTPGEMIRLNVPAVILQQAGSGLVLRAEPLDLTTEEERP